MVRVAARSLIVALVLLTACGGGGGGGDGSNGAVDGEVESSLPEPPAGKATIGGTLTVNGDPLAGEEVTLGDAVSEPAATGATGASGPSGPVAVTAADGTFVFEGVDPGSYSLVVGVLVEGAFSSDAFGLSWDDPCAAEGFQVLNGSVSDEATGEPIGVIAAASSARTSTNADQVSSIDVEAGDRTTQDIALECTLGGA